MEPTKNNRAALDGGNGAKTKDNDFFHNTDSGDGQGFSSIPEEMRVADMPPLTLYYSNTVGNNNTTYFPHKVITRGVEDMVRVVSFDHVVACFKNDHRKNENFIAADTLFMDCDNTHSDDPADWKVPRDVAAAFPGEPFYWILSRNHMKGKDNRAPRPKFHCYFSLGETVKSYYVYRQIQKVILSSFPFDRNATYFSFGVTDATAFFCDGRTEIWE